MNTCDTCKWWKEAEEEGKDSKFNQHWINLYGECESPNVGYPSIRDTSVSVGTSTYPGNGQHVDKHTIPLDKAYPSSADDHGLGFFTGPKFGCIHHEPDPALADQFLTGKISGADLALVKRAVESAMNSGWSPVGNISAHFDPTRGSTVYAQSITKKNQNEISQKTSNHRGKPVPSR